MTMIMEPHISSEMRECIDRCNEAHRICLETASHCLQMGGRHVEPGHMRLLLDCAEIAQTSANFMLRSSEFHGRTCGVCAEICERAASSCGGLGDDRQMCECSEICRRCAESCRKMAGHH